AKVLAGGADSQLVAELKKKFAAVKHAKPPASRKGSSEWYVVAQGFKGGRDKDLITASAEAYSASTSTDQAPDLV
ncbi:MAG: SAM-dependent methyltransferase, partial [Pseudomonadota bacterium]|nr:SAM-dependent methyltransferase [Pseudomonadota bacterium]